MSSGSKGKPILLWVVGFFVLLFLVYVLFANTIIKSILESKLGESYGAEVNIDDFDHSLYPTTVTLKGIALTNPTKPSHNQVFVGEANADVALKPLLDDQVIVNNLNLLEVQFDTERPSEGEVYRVPERSLSFNEIKAKAQEAVPTVDELLARNPLKTTAAIENANLTDIPLEYLFTGVSINFPTPEKSTISSNFESISLFDIPKMAPFKYKFSLPDSSE